MSIIWVGMTRITANPLVIRVFSVLFCENRYNKNPLKTRNDYFSFIYCPYRQQARGRYIWVGKRKNEHMPQCELSPLSLRGLRRFFYRQIFPVISIYIYFPTITIHALHRSPFRFNTKTNGGQAYEKFFWKIRFAFLQNRKSISYMYERGKIFTSKKGGEILKPSKKRVFDDFRKFDSFCKKVLKNEVCDYHNEMKRKQKRETLFSELSAHERKRLQTTDIYFPHFIT